MARPRSSAAAITSASLTDPPGCTTAVAPASATASRPSRNGKNASDATTLPFERSRRRLHHRDLDRVDAAHLPGADRQRPVRAGEDDRVRLHVRAHAPREPQRRPLLRRRLPFGHDADGRSVGPLGVGSRELGVDGRRPWISRLRHPIRFLVQHAAEERAHLGADRVLPAPISVGRFAIAAKSAVTTRRLVFFARIGLASSVERRRDHRLDERRRSAPSPSSASISRLSPTMPPNADSGSASRART